MQISTVQGEFEKYDADQVHSTNTSFTQVTVGMEQGLVYVCHFHVLLMRGTALDAIRIFLGLYECKDTCTLLMKNKHVTINLIATIVSYKFAHCLSHTLKINIVYLLVQIQSCYCMIEKISGNYWSEKQLQQLLYHHQMLLM